MSDKIKIVALLVMLLFARDTYCQTKSDTTGMVKEFNRVMSFTIQPYVSFTTVTKMNASPVVQEQDTMNLKGVFYKNQTNIYYSNEEEQMFVQDSFMIRINQERKSIWISKIDISSKEKMNVLPVNNSQFAALFKQKYDIKKIILNDSMSMLNFATKQSIDSLTSTHTSVQLTFFTKNYLPVMIQVESRMQQPLSDELSAELKNENIDQPKLIQTIKEVKYLVRSQTISVAFSDINNTKERAMKMPSWKEVLDYQETKEFIAKGSYKDYEITKTF